MRTRLRIIAAFFAICGLVTTAQAAVADEERNQTSSDVSITLVTGDRVVLPMGDVSKAWVDPGAGRDDVRFHIRRIDDTLTVTPSDAAVLVEDGSLDPRLFDVSRLLDYGYDDANRGDIPLVADSNSALAGNGLLTDVLETAGAAVTGTLDALGITLATVRKSDTAKLWTDVREGQVDKLWLDGVRHPTIDRSVPQTGAPKAWALGLTGDGTTVAVLDTGVDDSHPDLADRVVASENFTKEDDGDEIGHGTHVASTIAGGGNSSNGRYTGMAPDAELVSGKVCGQDECRESAILKGMEWAAVSERADVINLSLGDIDSKGNDPLEKAVNKLSRDTGALFVVSAGNDGPGASTVSSPGTATAALSVGAVNGNGKLANFSGRGPRTGDGAVKPDLTAPGVRITAARVKGSKLGKPADRFYQTLNGTSMAAPHVSGAAAILKQEHPEWSGSEVKAALMTSAKANPKTSVDGQGAGELNLAAAIGRDVFTKPASLSFGQQLWPHEDDRPISRTVSYHNDSDEPLNLDLSVKASDAPEEMFTLDDESLTVPAHGTASTKLTADTSVASSDGRIAGRVIATGGADELTTRFAVDKEVESYNVTLAHTGRGGGAPDSYSTAVFDHSNASDVHILDGPKREVTLRLPAGEYYVSSRILGDGEALVVDPVLEVDSDMTIDLDARQAEPVDVRVPGAKLTYGAAGFNLERDTSRFEDVIVGDSFDGVYLHQIGDDLPADQMQGKVSGYWTGRDKDDYALAWFTPGRVPSGFSERVNDDDLAELETDVAVGEGDKAAMGSWFAMSECLEGIPGAAECVRGPGWTTLPFPEKQLPTSVTTHVTPDVDWHTQLSVLPGGRTLWSSPASYEAGRRYSEQWNRAVFGPGPAVPMAGVGAIGPRATREGNRIKLGDLALYGDGAGHRGWAAGSAITGTTELYANGVLVGSDESPGTGSFKVAPEPLDYRLRVTHEPASSGGIGVRLGGPDAEEPDAGELDVTWTFASAHTSELQDLPLSVVRFTPPVNQRNELPFRPSVEVPLTIEGQDGVPSNRSVTVSASFDGGDTWEDAEVLGHQGRLRAVIRHPEGAENVSLRARATDVAGNTVTQTITNAYRIAQR